MRPWGCLSLSFPEVLLRADIFSQDNPFHYGHFPFTYNGQGGLLRPHLRLLPCLSSSHAGLYSLDMVNCPLSLGFLCVSSVRVNIVPGLVFLTSSLPRADLFLLSMTAALPDVTLLIKEVGDWRAPFCLPYHCWLNPGA